MTQITVHGMMLTDAVRPADQESIPKIAPRWRIDALTRAWEWSRRSRVPYSPFVAVKAL